AGPGLDRHSAGHALRADRRGPGGRGARDRGEADGPLPRGVRSDAGRPAPLRQAAVGRRAEPFPGRHGPAEGRAGLGRVGRIAHARIASEWWRGHSYYDLWWRGTWSSEGGGPTLNHAIHHIDLSLWLLGRPQAVAAMITNAGHDNAEVEDLSVAILQYERGLAELTSSVVHHGEQQEIVIQGEHARISQPWAAVAERARPNGFPENGGNTQLVAELDALAERQPRLEHTGHAGQLGDVIAAIRDGRTPLVDGEDGKRAIELVTAIYAAAIE